MFGRKPKDKMMRCECGASVRESAMSTHWIVDHLHKERQAVYVRFYPPFDQKKAS